ncbi:ankyrin repeat domain-containing protein [Micromonospora sp. MH99]|uniref:ankyrin repeat domain-containing protein n=1 Tax=Micromonospora sp. MH99 TaxID=1945510 RepID=UPI001F364C91|nr:ankyrin repeat domain-containing protein [Micromonospora sp. MH99]
MDRDAELVAAVRAADPAAVTTALAEGADPDSADSPFTPTVLSEAAGAGRLEIARLLVDAGASLRARRPQWQSPLRSAVSNGHLDVVRLLVDRGALDVEATDRSSLLFTAVAATRHRPQPAALEVLRYLLELGTDATPGEETPIVQAVLGPVAPATIRMLLSYGADPNSRRSDGTPVLILAARRGDHAAVDVLLTAGADPNAVDNHGHTALMHAIERNERAVSCALLLAGADHAGALGVARGWQRQGVQFDLGEMSVGLDDVPIARTAVRLHPTGYELRGDPAELRRWGQLVACATEELGDDEWDARTGTPYTLARTVAHRLVNDPAKSPTASWHRIELTGAELSTVRQAFVELVYAIRVTLPDGIGREYVRDTLDELDAQLP